jgi:hypothetical protein
MWIPEGIHLVTRGYKCCYHLVYPSKISTSVETASKQRFLSSRAFRFPVSHKLERRVCTGYLKHPKFFVFYFFCSRSKSLVYAHKLHQSSSFFASVKFAKGSANKRHEKEQSSNRACFMLRHRKQ